MSLRERQRIALLEWVEEQVETFHSDIADAEHWAMLHELSGLQGRALADGLVVDGLLEDARIDQGRWVSLTPAGVSALEGIRAKRADRIERNAYVRNTILRWLYDREPVRSLAAMIDDPDVHFYGDRLAEREVTRAFEYLRDLRMVRGKIAAGGDVLVPRLEARGIECVESGQAVSDFINPRPSGGNVYNTYLPNAQGVIVGEQQNFTQNNSAGVDPTAFVQLAGYLGQVSGTLGLGEGDRIELERAAEELHAEATSDSPEPGRMRMLTSRIADGLTNAGGTIAGQIALQMAQQALGTLG